MQILARELAQVDAENDDALLRAAETALDRARPRPDGTVYTSPALAARLVEQVLRDRDARVIDPACGTGVFLLAAWRRLGRGGRGARARLEQLRGWDIDAEAVEAARQVLGRAAGVNPGSLTQVVTHRDALDGPLPERFDAVVCNPPWVPSTRIRDAHRRALRARFETARGNWDLWCPFVQRATQLCRPGGRVALVLPDKLLCSGFATASRRWLSAHLDDRRITPEPDAFQRHAVHAITVVGTLREQARDGDERPWPVPADARDEAILEALRGAPTLADLAELRGAATVAEAYAWREHLRDDPCPGEDEHPVLNSGTIDPGEALWGRVPMRYLGGRWLHPVLPRHALSQVRQAQARHPKLIVASMTRRLEAVADPHGRWLGAKSTTLVLPRGAHQVERLSLWFASDVAHRWYRATYAGLAFRGGHFRVGPPQLRTLPVPDLAPATWSALAATDPRGRDSLLEASLGLAP